jgi:dTDP-4-amino-4,6-dideoxygalactose transaminase
VSPPPSVLPDGPAHAELPFHRPFVSGREGAAVARSLEGGHTAGNGPFAIQCERHLATLTGAEKVLLTHSCTGALEMAALLAGIGPGDEVIMPSFTFVSTANAFVLRGATPVFVDVRPEDLTIDPTAAEAAVTRLTRAVVPVHYAGGVADMAAVNAIADHAGIVVIEDAAQSIYATYRGHAGGTLGALGALSFHETKNLSCGEGGALLVSDPAYVDRAEVLQEKGTDRLRFVRGEIRAYTWVDIGSSFLMSDLSAAILSTQLEVGPEITAARRAIWEAYHAAFAPLEAEELVVRPAFGPDVHHNGHIYWLLAPDRETRDRVIARLGEDGVRAQFHYVPLHSSPAGLRFGRSAGQLAQTTDLAGRLVRLPLWVGMTRADVERVVDLVTDALVERRGAVRDRPHEAEPAVASAQAPGAS